MRVPILVAHGQTDRRVPFEQSTELVAELSRLGKTYEYVTYPTEGHGFLESGRSSTSTAGWRVSSTGT